MPKLTVEGVGTFDVPDGKRMVLALEDEAKVDQLHACGGNARCTTCRVEFQAGEPERMTVAEKNTLAARGLSGVRLSWPGIADETGFPRSAPSGFGPGFAARISDHIDRELRRFVRAAKRRMKIKSTRRRRAVLRARWPGPHLRFLASIAER